MPIYYQGKKLFIEQTEDAQSSQDDAEAQVPGNHKACIAQLDVRIKRLADFGRLRVPDQIVDEGDKIFAIKTRCGLRAYGWYHSKKKGVFVISHYIMKKWQKMRLGDRARALNNMKEYEETNNA